ncbi:protein SODIUM POTASSIUM ROOT defective [Sesamum angolense]|uniref:Protein SODIUM POTASSIUM ROOT defective n=1 Tax=Sesamum angolense TaxID=2727404 RepID=A0AAE1WPG8_9LAMI|nr:protein SODIUM POTASSIUM ROOT defective [Sesamum angolense]
MRKLMSCGRGRGRGRALQLLCLLPGAAYSSCSSCLCMRSDHHSAEEQNPLIPPTPAPKLKDVIAPPTLAFQLKPKMVVLRVSMHCNGCARKVEKHISKLEGVTSYQVDLETKMVVVVGDIVPVEVLESVSKVKNAQLWSNQF